MAYMLIFALYLGPMLNNPTLLRTFGFRQESFFVSLYLTFKVWSVGCDFVLRKFLLWFTRLNELRADRGAAKVGMESDMRNALIRNYAANKDPLFVSDVTIVTQKSHPSMLQRLAALKTLVRGTN